MWYAMQVLERVSAHSRANKYKVACTCTHAYEDVRTYTSLLLQINKKPPLGNSANERSQLEKQKHRFGSAKASCNLISRVCLFGTRRTFN